MEKTNSINWIGILYIAGAVWVMIWIWHKAVLSINPPPEIIPVTVSQGVQPQDEPDGSGNLTLKLDQKIHFRNRIITYKGIVDKSIVIDVINLDLDPETVYQYRVPLDKAKTGFSLSGSYYQLASVSKTKASLLKLK